MSAEAVTVVLHHSQSEGTAKLVLWGIANHHSDQGAWPSIATLAKYANIKERRVQQIIRELAASGEIAIEEQGGYGQQQYKTNRYLILLTCPADCDGTLQHRTGVQSVTIRGAISDSQGCNLESSGVQPTAPEPNKNLKKNLMLTSYRLPEDWQPKETDFLLMKEHFPLIDLKLETHAFKDYWKALPGAKGKKADWDATWRNWIRNSHKRSKPKDNNQETMRRWLDESN
jgi:hypothetical protein